MTDLSTPRIELKIEYLPISQIRPDPNNPRLHGKRHVRQLAKSIEAFGFNAPILIDHEGQIVAGHGRHAAAVLLGLLTVPTIGVGHLSPQQRRAYMVADNRLGDLSKWDGKALAGIMLELAEADLSFDVEAAGFSVGEIDLMSPLPRGTKAIRMTRSRNLDPPSLRPATFGTLAIMLCLPAALSMRRAIAQSWATTRPTRCSAIRRTTCRSMVM